MWILSVFLDFEVHLQFKKNFIWFTWERFSWRNEPVFIFCLHFPHFTDILKLISWNNAMTHPLYYTDFLLVSCV